MTTPTAGALDVSLGEAHIHLRRVRLRPDITIDEIHLDGGDIVILAPSDEAEKTTVQAGETRFRVMISEANVNTMLAANLPADAAVRNLRLVLLSGKVRLTGQIGRSVVHLPFTLEATPLIVNGLRIKLDFQTARVGIAMPSVIVEAIEQTINNNRSLPLDLAKLPVPVRLDEIRCEPGRISLIGRARLAWPLAAAMMSPAPFTAADAPVSPEATEENRDVELPAPA